MNRESKVLLKKIMNETGYEDPNELGLDFVFDSCGPGICTSCHTVYEPVEPDADENWCDECEGPFVISALVLMEVI